MSATFSLHHYIRGSRNGTGSGHPHQLLKVRFGYCSQLISRSPSDEIPHQILQQTPSTLMGEALFPLSHSLVIEFLRSFNLHASACEDMFQIIAGFAQQLAAGDSNANFQIEAHIDYVRIFWMEPIPGLYPMPMTQEQSTLVEAAPAPEWAIERLMNSKFDQSGVEDEMGDCSVCYDELVAENGTEEVTKMPCGHVYHKACILAWLQQSNSCPLCRRKLE